MKDIECPYCGAEWDWSGDSLAQDEECQENCPECDKDFIVICHYSVSYDSHKADCLNGAEHNYKPITGYPREYFENKRRCSMCSKEITLTSADLKDFAKEREHG